VKIENESTDNAGQKCSGVIISYSLSGDGNYVATLSTDGRLIQLDVWDLRSGYQSTVDKDDNEERLPSPISPMRLMWKIHDFVFGPQPKSKDYNEMPFAPKSCGQHQACFTNNVLSDLGM
jgi:WD40 repeat protein